MVLNFSAGWNHSLGSGPSV